ncbi:MAG TPA: DNA polymerase III subunit gamma/tau [Nitrospiria bacterium]|nr:DNA polymerase III subunit gamma/tau [Nitrospiria bacterium]
MTNYVVLARKWRPQQFDDVVGQEHVARTLSNALTAGRIAHAYLFAGPRGVGKTTMARLLAKALNCQAATAPTPTACGQCESCREIAQGIAADVMEIDGASSRGINEIRELRERINYAPLKGRRRVYIIDEVHMLTNEAFNALLKTLEEPPPHVVFIFATTELHKVPATIQSRCQQFLFRRLSRLEIVSRLELIAQREGFALSPVSLGLIAQAADGSLRDALSLLDQAVAFGGPSITEEDLRQLLGVIDRRQMAELFDALARRDGSGALAVIRSLSRQGQDLRQLCGMVLEWLRHLAVAKVCGTASPGEGPALLDLPEEERKAVEQLSGRFSAEELQRLFLLWGRVAEELKGSLDPLFAIEMGVVRSTQLPALESFGSLLHKVSELERRLGGAPDAPPMTQSAAPRSPARRSDRRPDTADDTADDSADERTSDDGVARPAAPAQPAPAASRPPEAGRSLDDTSAAPQAVSARASTPTPPSAVGQDSSIAWAALLDLVQQQKPYLATYLADFGLVEITGRDLVIGCSAASAVMADRIQTASNKEFLEMLIARQFGRPLRLKVITLQGAAAPAPSVAGVVPPLEPLVESALDLFGGRVVSPPQPTPAAPAPAVGQARPPHRPAKTASSSSEDQQGASP